MRRQTTDDDYSDNDNRVYGAELFSRCWLVNIKPSLIESRDHKVFARSRPRTYPRSHVGDIYDYDANNNSSRYKEIRKINCFPA